MSNTTHLNLACGDCRRVVSVSYSAADLHQGKIDLDEYRACPDCGTRMVEADYDETHRIAVPEPSSKKPAPKKATPKKVAPRAFTPKKVS